MSFHLAEINLARCKAPLDSPVMRDFVELLDAMNALADVSPGFVWRLKAAAGGDPGIAGHPDPRVIANLSVWTGIEALHQYTYRSSHAYAFRNRAQWFDAMAGPHFAMWWIEAGTVPTLEEALRRVEILERNGSSQEAFTFKQPFPAPGA